MMKKIIYRLYFAFILVAHWNLSAQELLRNGTFAQGGTLQNVYVQHGILEWWGSTGKNESPPDVHTAFTGYWGVQQHPYEGDTYVGLVCRPNGTSEFIYQKLQTPLMPGKHYQFAVYASTSADYISATRETPTIKRNFTDPCRIVISGKKKHKGDLDILAKSSPITWLEWQKIWLDFEVDEPYKFFVISVEIAPVTQQTGQESRKPAGHVLLDKASLQLK